MTSEVMDIRRSARYCPHGLTMKNIWMLPAFLAVAFFLFTIWTIVTTGQALGFVAEHTHGAWGAQIALDLFNALFAGIYFANVQSQQYRFRAWPYVLLTLCTGSPGVLALAARVLYARRSTPAAESRDSHPAPPVRV
jgi:hypothetical protein